MKRVIAVTFTTGNDKTSQYHYQVLDNYLYEKGDYVVVDVRGELKVAKVQSEINPLDAIRPDLKPIVCKVHKGNFNKHQEAAKRRKAIQSKLKDIEAKVETEIKLEMLAKHSPEAASLLEELKELG